MVKRTILGLVLRRGLTAHPTQLSRWIHTVNHIRQFMQPDHWNVLYELPLKNLLIIFKVLIDERGVKL